MRLPGSLASTPPPVVRPQRPLPHDSDDPFWLLTEIIHDGPLLSSPTGSNGSACGRSAKLAQVARATIRKTDAHESTSWSSRGYTHSAATESERSCASQRSVSGQHFPQNQHWCRLVRVRIPPSPPFALYQIRTSLTRNHSTNSSKLVRFSTRSRIICSASVTTVWLVSRYPLRATKRSTVKSAVRLFPSGNRGSWRASG